MAEEIKDEQKDEQKDIDYIEAIKKLKDNSVPKDEYEKIQQEKKDLLKALVDGEQLEKDNDLSKKSASELREELFNNDNLSNLEYISKALELRQAVMAEDGVDIFLPYGEKIAPDQNDIDSANRVAEAFESCIEYADGNSEIFTQELQRITKDTAPMIRRR